MIPFEVDQHIIFGKGNNVAIAWVSNPE